LRPTDRWECDPDGGWWLMAADGPRYRAIGNSMAVPELRWIGERIEMVDKVLHEVRP
jgi:DNA (cytosine-5)-methyltransferase 1